MKRRTLPLLPGLKWEGKIHVVDKTEFGYLVDFEAIDHKANQEKIVMDRTILSAKQLKDWTGWEDETAT